MRLAKEPEHFTLYRQMETALGERVDARASRSGRRGRLAPTMCSLASSAIHRGMVMMVPRRDLLGRSGRRRCTRRSGRWRGGCSLRKRHGLTARYTRDTHVGVSCLEESKPDLPRKGKITVNSLRQTTAWTSLAVDCTRLFPQSNPRPNMPCSSQIRRRGSSYFNDRPS
jgi:hypothetical protein